MCIAEAQQVMAKKAVLEGKSDAVLAKLCFGILNQFRHAYEVLSGVPGEFFRKCLIPCFKFYISINIAMYDLLALKYASLDAYAQG
jgi:hypothetical protein